MTMRTAVPGTRPPATVPEGSNDAVTPTANQQRSETQEMTATRELGIPPAQAAELPKVAATPTPAPTSIVSTLLEKKREYEASRQQAIDELLNTVGNAKSQLAELGWEDPDEHRTPAAAYRSTGRRPGRPRGSTNAARQVTVRPVHTAERKVIPELKNKLCPVCGKKGHDARSHRKENLAAIAAGKRDAKR